MISGRVTDAETDEGITFANIFVKGVDSTVSTDIDGYYRMQVSPSAGIIAAGLIGYEKSFRAIRRGSKQQVINLSWSASILLSKKKQSSKKARLRR